MRERNRDSRQRLDDVQIASPCHADWYAMTGDHRVRFCDSCRRHVYNLSAMDVEEAAALIEKTEGQICIRLFRRTDGAVLTEDCPVGEELARRKRRMVVSGLALGAAAAVTLSAVAFIPLLELASSPSEPGEYSTTGQAQMGSLGPAEPIREVKPPAAGQWAMGGPPASTEMGRLVPVPTPVKRRRDRRRHRR